MFFFFVGGVDQQVARVLKSGVARCINCGSRADLVEHEKVLKLFFVPVWKWPAEEPALHCRNCNLFFPQSFTLPPPPTTSSASDVTEEGIRCHFCNRGLEPHFRFCPFCGSSL